VGRRFESTTTSKKRKDISLLGKILDVRAVHWVLADFELPSEK